MKIHGAPDMEVLTTETTENREKEKLFISNRVGHRGLIILCINPLTDLSFRGATGAEESHPPQFVGMRSFAPLRMTQIF
jgi:hypothetical protein